ncbi:hypothetical protein WSS_A30509 [Rhodococcus opacus M213]|uniref:Uncharacterized protein n=1 Tax=Rhodococcus opacus M213 TaxID=1129896 RepID=K8XDI9_RHOOP|nr:hypothetical protein WSS_A30509 [Rhodococcus opacus M213]
MAPHDRFRTISAAAPAGVWEPDMARLCLAENRRKRLLSGSVITGSPPNRNPTMPSLPISLCPGGTCLRGVLVVGHRRRVGPSNHDCCIGWQRRSFGATRDVLPPLVVNGIQCIVRGGTAWWRLPVEFWSTGTVYAVFARKDLCTKLAQKLIAMVCGSGFRRTPSALAGTRNPTIRCSLRYRIPDEVPQGFALAHAAVVRCRGTRRQHRRARYRPPGYRRQSSGPA